MCVCVCMCVYVCVCVCLQKNTFKDQVYLVCNLKSALSTGDM